MKSIASAAIFAYILYKMEEIYKITCLIHPIAVCIVFFPSNKQPAHQSTSYNHILTITTMYEKEDSDIQI